MYIVLHQAPIITWWTLNHLSAPLFMLRICNNPWALFLLPHGMFVPFWSCLFITESAEIGVNWHNISMLWKAPCMRVTGRCSLLHGKMYKRIFWQLKFWIFVITTAEDKNKVWTFSKWSSCATPTKIFWALLTHSIVLKNNITKLLSVNYPRILMITLSDERNNMCASQNLSHSKKYSKEILKKAIFPKFSFIITLLWLRKCLRRVLS